jgi:hypothetical protein
MGISYNGTRTLSFIKFTEPGNSMLVELLLKSLEQLGIAKHFPNELLAIKVDAVSHSPLQKSSRTFMQSFAVGREGNWSQSW